MSISRSISIAIFNTDLLFQEMLKELFPTWQAVRWRYREVIIFTAGQMKDPRPLVQHVYEMQVEDYLSEMRTSGIYPSIAAGLFKSLHTEYIVRLPHDPFHNKYINYYKHHPTDGDPSDTRPVYWPSRVYHFEYISHKVELDRHTEEEEILPCAMYIWEPDEAMTDSLLSICSEISKHQAVTDLRISFVTCNSLEAPRLLNPVTVYLSYCELPDDFVEKILRQLKGSGESLQRLRLSRMILGPLESLLDELLEDLVAHHERKREAGLAQRKLLLWLFGDKIFHPTNLSEEFVEKWRNRCKKVNSIDCKIDDGEDEDDSDSDSTSGDSEYE